MMSSCWQISFFPSSPASAEFEEFIENYFEVTACNYDDDGNDEYIGYQSGAFNEPEMLQAAKSCGLILPRYQITRLESSNWLKDYVIKFAPFEVEDFMIYGIHEETSPHTSLIPLQIYAATAFGSDHQTTRCCLKAVSELYHQGFQAQNILDVGTGSGILSLAAAKLWKNNCKITAVDIDEESVWVTQDNARRNNVDAMIAAVPSNGYQNPLIAQNAPYDLILANILARPLIEMAPDLGNSLKSGGYCILSGFVEEQEDWVVSEHQKQHLKLIRLYRLDNWRAALMQKE